MVTKLKALLKAHREEVAYLFFGALTTVVSIASFALLSRLFQAMMTPGAALNAANFLSLIISVAFAYVTNRRFVFRSRSRGKAVLSEMATFFAGRTFTVVLDMVLMNLLVTGLGLWDLGAKTLVTVVVIILNYVIAKRWVFKKQEDKPEQKRMGKT
jgi:putative flippase GtrA